MAKRFKKALVVGLSLALCLSLLPMAAFAAGENEIPCGIEGCEGMAALTHKNDNDNSNALYYLCPDCGGHTHNANKTDEWVTGETPDGSKCEHGNDPATCPTCNANEGGEEKCEHGNDPATCPTCNPDEGDGEDPNNPDPDPQPGYEIPDIDIPQGDLPGEEIEDEDIPLAGLMTRAEFVNYLYVQAGSPDAELSTFIDVAEDHEYAAAIGWAQANGIAKGVGETKFAPDNIVTVEQARLFLARYAESQGIEMPELAAWAGKDPKDILDNADEVLGEFFGEDLAEDAA